jgi:arylsulfatase A
MLALLPALWLAAAPDTPRPPNIVLILADDLGFAELGCYGQKKIRTPEIDKLAAGGVRFTQFYAGNAVCAPSRCCLMTGRHPGHATIRDNREAKPEGQEPILATDTTLTEVLKARGYATFAAGKWGLGMFGTSGDPLKHGFDGFLGYNCQRHAHTHYPTYLYRNAERFDLKGNNGDTGDTYTHDLFEAGAMEFIQANRSKPFFLYLPVTVPHVAVQVPDDSLNEYRGQLGDDPAYDGKKGYRKHPAPHAGYAGMVTRLDRTVGRIAAKLRELKLDSNTLILFTSDNGGTHNVGGADSAFFESAGTLRGLKGSLYEGGIRVPMIAYQPGTVPAGKTIAEPFAFWDLLPTLANRAGAKAPTGLDGIDFSAALTGRGEQQQHEFLYWEFPGYGGQQAVRVGNLKAVRQKLKTTAIQTELYDLASDPNETTDLAKQRPADVAKLDALMQREHVPSALFPLPKIDPAK